MSPTTMNRFGRLVGYALPAVLLMVSASTAGAQATSADSIGGSQAYWYVYIAYAVVVVLVLGWVVSIVLRLRDVEDRLGRG